MSTKAPGRAKPKPPSRRPSQATRQPSSRGGTRFFGGYRRLEYARLREYPQSDYEMCVTNPDTYKLLFGMVQDLLAANMGGKYFLLSTDEPYYVGLASNQQCDEATQAKADGSVGRLLAEFITKAAGYLHERGRAVIFWGEYPLKPADIEHLPPYLVNGEVYGPEFDPVFKAHGIRQMVYTSTEGEEPLFPEYFTAVAWEKVHATKLPTMRVNGMVSEITSAVERRQADLMGAVIAGWADEGLHPETFWAGYATGTAVAWHVENLDPRILLDSFFNLLRLPDGFDGAGLSVDERRGSILGRQLGVGTLLGAQAHLR